MTHPRPRTMAARLPLLVIALLALLPAGVSTAMDAALLVALHTQEVSP